MSGYVKLFSSILASTIWRESNETRLVWITMLAMADMHGFVSASIPGLADFARVSITACEAALEALSSPDEYSRTKEYEGRRIKAEDGGWRILNHEKYREMLKSDTYPCAEERYGKIYFIEHDGLIKIGFSQNPWARFAALKTGMSGNPILLGHYSGTLRDELNLQDMFAGSRKNREWYEKTPALLELIAKKCQPTTVVLPHATNSDRKLQYAEASTTTKADTVLSLSTVEDRIRSIHGWYSEQMGGDVRLDSGSERLWFEWIKAGFEDDDFKRVLKHIRDGIGRGERNQGALKLVNILSHGFADDLLIAKQNFTTPVKNGKKNKENFEPQGAKKL